MSANKVLLIGNDINNATASYSWDDLLNGLIIHANLAEKPHMENKPFPMLYEEIYLNSARINKTKELSLKKFIASNTGKLEPNVIHERIMQMDVKNLLTTNYDLTLEKCLTEKTAKIVNQGAVREIIYSLFRVHKFENKNIWHIHGSELSPTSITLGYEQYSGYLQQMRNYVASGTKGTYKNHEFEALIRRISKSNLNYDSWVEFFFTYDVHILGLNLDFVEMHLWWLLTYRARAVVEGRISIDNTIYYYYPSKFESDSKPKLELLQVNGVTTVPIALRGTNKKGYYQKVLDYIDSQ